MECTSVFNGNQRVTEEVMSEKSIEKKEKAKVFYTDLLHKALDEIGQYSEKLVMVCGPLRGNVQDIARMSENLNSLQAQIRRIAVDEIVFDQTAYRESELTDPPHKVEMKLEIFYRGILTSGKISKVYVLPGWETSVGTQKEIAYAKEAKLIIEYL
jgi:hypothetical protein